MEEASDQMPQVPEDVPLNGAFAFAGESGTELLSQDTSLAPDSITHAVCSGGSYRVRYSRRQPASPQSTRRQTAANFHNEPGDVYEITGGAAEPNETCFLTTPVLVARIALPAQSRPGTCRDEHVADLTRLAGRELIACWHLAGFDDGTQALAAQFVTVDTSALAAVALAQDRVTLFQALPGHYFGPGESVWRVDDGGVFDPDAIRILFMAQLPQGQAAAIVWAGAEGESAELMAADSTRHARSILTHYRYWSPL